MILPSYFAEIHSLYHDLLRINKVNSYQEMPGIIEPHFSKAIYKFYKSTCEFTPNVDEISYLSGYYLFDWARPGVVAAFARSPDGIGATSTHRNTQATTARKRLQKTAHLPDQPL